jgi:hypothetical protein
VVQAHAIADEAQHRLIHRVPRLDDGTVHVNACRVYATPTGLSGVPPLGDVISALTTASNREPASPE